MGEPNCEICTIDGVKSEPTVCERHYQRAAQRLADEENAAEAIQIALRALLEQWTAMRGTPDDAFYDWCDYDMEIEASKVVFERCAKQLRDVLTRLSPPEEPR